MRGDLAYPNKVKQLKRVNDLEEIEEILNLVGEKETLQACRSVTIAPKTDGNKNSPVVLDFRGRF